MTALTLGSMFAYPLHVGSWKRPAGSIDYRVTNPFDGPDFLNGGTHRATDVGNTRMDDTIKAPAACAAMGLRHTDGALGVRFDLGYGVTIDLWHLSKTIFVGKWQPVARGQACGATGNSGAPLPDGSPMPAHTHIRAERNRVPFDIERYLPMVERAPIPLILSTEVSDVVIPGKFLRHVQNRRAALTSDSHFRSAGGTDDSLGTLPAGTVLYPVWVVEARAVGTAPDKAEWYGAAAYVGGTYQSGLVHSSVLPRSADGSGVVLEPIEAADCRAQETTIAQLRTAIGRARTANSGARQAQAAVEAALA